MLGWEITGRPNKKTKANRASQNMEHSNVKNTTDYRFCHLAFQKAKHRSSTTGKVRQGLESSRNGSHKVSNKHLRNSVSAVTLQLRAVARSVRVWTSQNTDFWLKKFKKTHGDGDSERERERDWTERHTALTRSALIAQWRQKLAREPFAFERLSLAAFCGDHMVGFP